jgi:hypothetical protein
MPLNATFFRRSNQMNDTQFGYQWNSLTSMFWAFCTTVNQCLIYLVIEELENVGMFILSIIRLFQHCLQALCRRRRPRRLPRDPPCLTYHHRLVAYRPLFLLYHCHLLITHHHCLTNCPRLATRRHRLLVHRPRLATCHRRLQGSHHHHACRLPHRPTREVPRI